MSPQLVPEPALAHLAREASSHHARTPISRLWDRCISPDEYQYLDSLGRCHPCRSIGTKQVGRIAPSDSRPTAAPRSTPSLKAQLRCYGERDHYSGQTLGDRTWRTTSMRSSRTIFSASKAA